MIIKNTELKNINDKYKDKIYVIHEEDITNEDLEELKKYCQCKNCINEESVNFCSCCIGCLKSSLPSQYIINKAREIKYGFDVILGFYVYINIK